MNGKTKGWITTGVSLGFIITLAISFGGVQKGVTHNKEDIKEVKVDVEEAEDELVERKIIDREQSIYIEQMQQNQLKFIAEFKELQQAK